MKSTGTNREFRLMPKIVSASHFFVGLGAGVAILTVPVLTLAPGLDLPHRVAAWIDGPPPQVAQARPDDVAISRPQRGYRPGEPTPGSVPPPTLQPVNIPTPAAPGHNQAEAPAAIGNAAVHTGVIRSGGAPVFVRRVAGFESSDDPQIADGSPVLVSTAAGLRVGNQQWRAVRGLNGVAGWVPSEQVAVDGEAPPQPLMASATGPVPRPTMAVATGPTPQPTNNPSKAVIANTDGTGVVLRNSPNDRDRSRSGLMDGMSVSVLERSGADWVHVRSDNGLSGWIPSRYLRP